MSDIEKRNKPWFEAATRGDLESLKESFKYIQIGHEDSDAMRKVNIKEQNYYGQTALVLTTYNGHQHCVEWLLTREISADVNIQSNNNETALIKAARIGDKKILNLLLDHGANINTQGFRNLTPLMNAICNGHTECALLLIERGALLNVVDDLGSTALMKAAHAENYTCLGKLVERNALLNVTDNNGQTALMKAAAKGNRKCVEVLVEKKAHVDVRDRTASTALVKVMASWSTDRLQHETFRKDALEIVSILLTDGASINVVDCNNETLLMKAASVGFFKMVKDLLGRGARMDIFNMTGQSPIMLAAKNGHLETLKKLFKHPEAYDVKNIVDLDGNTAIMHAAFNNHGGCVKFLAESGVEVDVVDRTRSTPLMHMAKLGAGAAVEALVDAKAYVGRRNRDGDTAWDLAVGAPFRHLLEIH